MDIILKTVKDDLFVTANFNVSPPIIQMTPNVSKAVVWKITNDRISDSEGNLFWDIWSIDVPVPRLYKYKESDNQLWKVYIDTKKSKIAFYSRNVLLKESGLYYQLGSLKLEFRKVAKPFVFIPAASVVFSKLAIPKPLIPSTFPNILQGVVDLSDGEGDFVQVRLDSKLEDALFGLAKDYVKEKELGWNIEKPLSWTEYKDGGPHVTLSTNMKKYIGKSATVKVSSVPFHFTTDTSRWIALPVMLPPFLKCKYDCHISIGQEKPNLRRLGGR